MNERRSKLAAVAIAVAMAVTALISLTVPVRSQDLSTSTVLPLFHSTMTFTATGQTQSAPIAGFASATVTLSGSATAATLQILASNDAGAHYYAIPFSTGAYSGNVLQVTTPGPFPAYSGTATAYLVNLAGFDHFEIVTSGTFTGASVTAKVTASANKGPF